MQDFMELLIEEGDYEQEFLKAAEESQLPLYIYGKGEVAQRVMHVLKEQGIAAAGSIIDDVFRKHNLEDDALAISEINARGGVNVLAGFWDYRAALKKLRNVSGIRHAGCLNRIYDTQRIDRKYIAQNRNLFAETFQWLNDEASRNTFAAYLNANIANDARYMFPVCQPLDEQYFFYWNKMKAGESMTYIVCGAYDGDTVESIIRRAGKAGTVYAFEPDPENWRALHDRIQTRLWDYGWKINTVNKGVSSCAGYAYFDSVMGSTARGICRIAEKSQIKGKKIKVNLTTIDEELMESIQSPAFITMDIEGSELAALQGAEQVIRTYKPHMAISVYHKRKDLISIPQKIKSMDPAYQLYMTAHCSWSEEVVLYAVYPHHGLRK